MIYHEERLDGVHWRLAGFINQAIHRLSKHHPDWLILCGWRGEKKQHEAFLKGTSKVDWPNGKHNRVDFDGKPCSWAVDLSPWPYDAGKDEKRLYLVAGYIMALADEWGVKVRIGADWDSDFATLDQSLKDPWHIELVEPV